MMTERKMKFTELRILFIILQVYCATKSIAQAVKNWINANLNSLDYYWNLKFSHRNYMYFNNCKELWEDIRTLLGNN